MLYNGPEVMVNKKMQLEYFAIFESILIYEAGYRTDRSGGTVYTCIREVLGLNPDWGTGYHN